MRRTGIAMDLGTSGFRGQTVDLETMEILGTVITSRHPLPGANVIDHLNFALEAGGDVAHRVIMTTINQVIKILHEPQDKVERFAVCGNPIQLSLFENIEIRDLAYAGKKKQELLGVVSPDRGSKEYKASSFSLLNLPDDCFVYIPPAVKHEIGADALALLVFSGILEKKEISLATDYGTNAEMAIKVGDKIITGSCAAGPALEGQHVSRGMLAAPGAIADLVPTREGDKCLILNKDMQLEDGDVVSLGDGSTYSHGSLRAEGVTGTGVIAAVSRGLEEKLISLPCIETATTYLHLADDIRFGEDDLIEAGKAIGAIRAGYITLAAEAGISVEEIETAVMAGASGTYVDALKAMHVGMVPPTVKEIYQVGNTSLLLAMEIVQQPGRLQQLNDIAVELSASHCMFGASRVFERAYLLEISYWTEGLPWEQYQKLAEVYKLPHLPPLDKNVQVVKKVLRDISDIGAAGLRTIEKVGEESYCRLEGCNSCGNCVDECPEHALVLDNEAGITLRMDLCTGTACRRCEHVCPEKVFQLFEFWSKKEEA